MTLFTLSIRNADDKNENFADFFFRDKTDFTLHKYVLTLQKNMHMHEQALKTRIGNASFNKLKHFILYSGAFSLPLTCKHSNIKSPLLTRKGNQNMESHENR